MPGPSQQEPQPIKPFEVLLAIFAAWFGALLMVSLLMLISGQPPDQAPEGMAAQLYVLGSSLCFAGLVVLYIRMRGFPLVAAFRPAPVPPHILLVCIAIIVGVVFVTDEIDRLMAMLIPVPAELEASSRAFYQVDSYGELFLLILNAMVLAAVIEECVFRGFLQQVMELELPVYHAVIYTSLAWTATHFGVYLVYHGLQIFIFGFILGYLTWRTRSVITAILCHFVANGIAVLYYNFDTEAPIPVYEWGAHVSPILLVIGLAMAVEGIRYLERYYPTSSLASSSHSSSD